MSNPRIIYHPGPLPDASGKLTPVEPIDLGVDLPSALQWIRRRLGLRAHGELLETARYLNETLPLPDPEALALLEDQPAARPPTKRRLRRNAEPLPPAPSGPVLNLPAGDLLPPSED